MRAYVSGASGFIGRHVVRVLREAGWEVGEEFVDVGDTIGLRRAMWFSSEKAKREFGYSPGPVEAAVERAVADVLRRPPAELSVHE